MKEADVPTVAGDQPPYFAVSMLKLAVMSLCTIGVYEIYWFYRNWTLIKQRDKTDIAPIWRAIFAVLFCYQCFSRISEHAAFLGLRPFAPPGLLAAGWIISVLLVRLPDPYWVVSLFSFVFVLPAQALANRVNAEVAPNHNRNRRFTAWNITWVAAAVVLAILAAIGATVPD